MMQRLDHLPDDILVLILSLLSVPDILSVRATCRYLFAVTYTHSIWLSALSHLRHRAPLPTHVLPRPATSASDTKALSQDILEGAARNVLRLSSNWNSPSPVPTSCTLIKGARHIDKLQLLDDGKWLLALTDGERLSLYDLRKESEPEGDGDGDGGGDERPKKSPFPRVFQPVKRVAEHSRSSGRGWHCGFECYLDGEELMVLLCWRNQTDLLRINLHPDYARPARGPPRMRFELLQSFERVRESALTPVAIDRDVLVYPAQSGQLRIVNYRTWEEGAVSTWNPSPATNVAEGWSREDIVALKLVPPHVLVLKPTSMQFFHLPALQRSSSSRSTAEPASRPGPVFHIPYRIDAAAFSDCWRSPGPGAAAVTGRNDPELDTDTDTDTDTNTDTVQPLSVLVRDVDNWTLVHYRFRPISTHPSHLALSLSLSINTPLPLPPYLPMPDQIDALTEVAFAQRDRHNTFALGRTGARGVVQGPNVLLGYTAPWLAAAEAGPRGKAAGSVTCEIGRNTPLRILEGGNGMSVDEATGRIAVGEADGDIWVFGFGFDDM